MANTEILREALTFITDHPEKHKQDVWTCETGACLAGHVALLNGYQIARSKITGDLRDGTVIDPATDAWVSVPDVARNLLDIGHLTSHILFNGNNTRDILALMVKDIENGDGLSDHWEFNDETSQYQRIGADRA